MTGAWHKARAETVSSSSYSHRCRQRPVSHLPRFSSKLHALQCAGVSYGACPLLPKKNGACTASRNSGRFPDKHVASYRTRLQRLRTPRQLSRALHFLSNHLVILQDMHQRWIERRLEIASFLVRQRRQVAIRRKGAHGRLKGSG